MASKTQQNLDSEGLQAIEQDNFPEVVPGQQLPSRKNSLTSPEPYNAADAESVNVEPTQQWHDHKGRIYTPVPADENQGQFRPPSAAPPYSDHEIEKQQHIVEQNSARQRKIMGMSRKVSIWVGAVVILLLIIAVVLGAVLGTVLNTDHKNQPNAASGPMRIKDRSGLAMLNADDDVYIYYMSESGSIVETQFGTLWSQNKTALPPSTNVTTGADPGSPIAAITYSMFGGTNYRQLFYFNNEGGIMTINATGNATWGEAYAPVPNGKPSQSRTVALTAVAATNAADGAHLNGIRVYYGSSDGYIQEIGCDFTGSNPQWHIWSSFPDSDPSSGVSSVVVSEVNHLYLRNSTTGSLQQWMWDYTNPGPWTPGASSSTGNGVAKGGSIAAATDGTNTDYIFYQTSGSSTALSQYSGTGSSIDSPSTNVPSIQSAPLGYSLTATYIETTGAVVLNQNSQDTSQLLFASVTRDGRSQEYSTDTGKGTK